MNVTEKQRLELGSLSSEFKILVLIVSHIFFRIFLVMGELSIKKSTFSAALIVSFLSLVHKAIGNTSSRPYQFGMFFSFIAIGFHLFATLVAARAGMLCFRLSKSLDSHLSASHDAPDSQTLEENPIRYDKQLDMFDFQRFLILCEQLQLTGMTIYLPSALFLIFYMFERIEFAIVIYAITGIGAWAVYRLGFWKLSVLWDDLNYVCSRCKSVLGIGESK
jgi:hypothetical protein